VDHTEERGRRNNCPHIAHADIAGVLTRKKKEMTHIKGVILYWKAGDIWGQWLSIVSENCSGTLGVEGTGKFRKWG